MENVSRFILSAFVQDDAYFTPDLVVPDGCECILFLSAKPRRGQNYDVLDSSGGRTLNRLPVSVYWIAPSPLSCEARLAGIMHISPSSKELTNPSLMVSFVVEIVLSKGP